MASDSIKGTVQDLSGKASGHAENAKGSVEDAANRASAQVHKLTDGASEAAGDLYARAKDKVREAADAVPDSASDALASGQRAYDHGAKHVSRQIAKQPLEALILAAAIGYLVGWATSRG